MPATPVIHRKFTGFAHTPHRRLTCCPQGATATFQVFRNLLDLRAQQMHDLTARVKQVEDDIALLEGRLERLRNRYYATRGATPQAPPHGSREEKDAILREHLFRPRQLQGGSE